MLLELEKQFPARYGDTRDVVQRAFSSKPEPGLAARLKQENPDGYNAAKTKAIEGGLIGGTPRQPPAPASQQPTAVELADAVKRFPKERCRDLFLREANKPGEIYSNLPKAERDEAKLAAQHFGIVPSEGGSNVRFNYATSRERAAARAKKEDAVRAVEQRQANELPPGIHRDAKGELTLVDSVAFEAWKAEKAANKEAIAFLESEAA